jgi:hypothetical protein
MEASIAGVGGRARSSLRVEVSEPKRRSTPSGSRSTTGTTASQTTLITHPPISHIEGKPRLLQIMEKIKMKVVEEHFDQKDSAPFLVASHVSQEELREYWEHDAYENSPFTLRFLELSNDGKLWIVELPTSVSHEIVAKMFGNAFLVACFAFMDRINFIGRPTIRFNHQGLEADETYGPRPNIPHSVRPLGLPNNMWITFVLEVGKSQSWLSMRRKTIQWYAYPNIEYILLIDINDDATRMEYEFYTVQLNPLVTNHAGDVILPNIPHGDFDYDPNGGAQEIITFDIRRLLGLPPGPPPLLPLPNGIPDSVDVDLRPVLNAARENYLLSPG